MNDQSATQQVLIQIEDTPNPNAWKFVLDRPVLLEGKASFSNPTEAEGNRLALDLLAILSVKQVHFFQNVVTVSANFDCDPKEVQESALSVLQTRMPVHNPAFGVEHSKKAQREKLTPELQKIEEILDRTIRPGLQGDGGDIEILRYENNQLHVMYQGACGSCPSSTSGTLMAIEGILRDEFNPQIEVIPI